MLRSEWDWARNRGGKPDLTQLPILPCPGMGDAWIGVHAGEGAGGILRSRPRPNSMLLG